METRQAKFAVGELVHHKLFHYRGVVVDVDPEFQGTEEWYQQVARSQPPRDHPWYHVLVHDAGYNTYVAERNLEPDISRDPIIHPDVDLFFDSFDDGVYLSQSRNN